MSAADPAGAPPPLLECRELSIRHENAQRATPAGLSLTVRRGEVVLVLGPSGCGKSTLALAAAGLLPGSAPAELSGEVLLGGVPATESTSRAERVGIVFQDADAQIVTGSVFDEVAFGMENLLWPVARIEQRAEWALRRMGLWERRDHAPELLSGGERQRLAIAAAIAIGAPLLVLDEPTANLDAAARAESYELLAGLMADGEHGILLIEHNLDEAMRIATRLLVLDEQGAVLADGPPRKLIAERGDELERLGVWLPIASLAARRLREAGWPLRGMPLTSPELTTAIDETAAAALGAHPRASGDTHPGAPERAAGAPAAAHPDGTPASAARAAADAPPAAALEARGITVRRRGRTIIKDLSLRIPRASFTALIGPNGAGKSTLLLALAGLEAPAAGIVLAHGENVAQLSAAELRAQTGFVFQNPEHQFIRSTVRDELDIELRANRTPEADRRELVDACLRRFGLLEHAARHPFLLSGGQKRRLSVATALVRAAGTLVLDEPTFGQDRARAEALVRLLRELHEEGTTIVMATHDLQLVAEHATHIAVMSGGRIMQAGPASRVLASGALEAAGLGLPPLMTAMRGVRAFPRLREVTRLHELREHPWPPSRTLPLPQQAAAPSPPGEPAPGHASPAHGHEVPRNHEEDGQDAPGLTASSAQAAAPGLASPPRRAAAPERPAADRSRLDRPAVAEARALRMPWLHRRHPLAKMAVPLAAIIALFFTRDPATPAACILIAQIAILSGTRMRLTARLAITAAPWVAAAVLSCTLGAWADPGAFSDTPVLLQAGAWALHEGAWREGLATGLRLVAITMLAWLASGTTAAGDLIRALVQHLRVPYRFGYAALAASGFVPRFRAELTSIERAHRARGLSGTSAAALLRRRTAALVPLMAGALLHAERVALSMDARGFGHARHRTERTPLRWNGWDTLLVLASASVAAAVFTLAPRFPFP